MTVPNTPAGSTPGPDPYAPPFPPQPSDRTQRPPLGPELRIGAVVTVAGAVLGVVLGLLWLWLAPRVGFDVQDNHILYRDPEGEQAIAAVGVFSLFGLVLGLLTALGAFLWTRTRGGGIAVAAGLAVGGLLGSIIGWQLGSRLGPTTDLRAHAIAVGNGGRFDGPLQLTAHGALLVWPMTAMIALLALSAAFGKREPDRPPYWATLPPQVPQNPWTPPAPQAPEVTPAPQASGAPEASKTPEAPQSPESPKTPGAPQAAEAPEGSSDSPAPPADSQ